MKKGSLPILLLLSSLMVFMSIEPIHSSAQSQVSELLVEYAEDVRMTFGEEIDEQVEKREKVSTNVELWSLVEDTNVEAFQQKLEKDPNVLFVELNEEREVAAESSSDPFIEEQWWLPHVGAEAIWSRVSEQKRPVSVAVIDSGVHVAHEDLETRIREDGFNFYNDNSDVHDEMGHGTKVAGVIAAEYDNSVGISGIAGPFNVNILPLKVFGSSQTTKTSYIVKAIEYAIEHKVDVINLSLGGPVKSDIENKAIQNAIESGITVVAAAGNKAEEDNRPFYPASYDNVISVGSVDHNNQHVKSSNFNDSLSLVAPGTTIYTTMNGGGYGMAEGTSFSSPIVAGAVAILKSLEPNKTPQDIKKMLQSSTIPLGTLNGTVEYFGSGLLSLDRLQQKLPIPEVPVQRVELNAQAVTMDLSSGISSTTNLASVQSYVESISSVVYEQEPNNMFSQANWLYENSDMRGTITDTHKDVDFYQLNLKSRGVLKLEGEWTTEDFAGGYNNQFLQIDLYDEKQQWIGKADYKKIANGENGLSLEVGLRQGVYYIAVSQTTANDEFFMNHEYEISTTHTPGDSVDDRPNFILGEIRMKVNDRKFVLNKEDEKTEWDSSDRDVADTDTTTESKFLLYAKVHPTNATDQSVIWSSADPSIAEVDQQGVVTAKNVGTTFVTATARTAGVTEIATINVVRNGQGYKFIGDFQDEKVYSDKVFTVTFTQPLSLFKNYTQDIVIARNPDGNERVKDFTAKVNPLNHKQLLIEPNKLWQEGYHYLTVTKNIQNSQLNPLTKESRLLFYSYNK